jgi:hypothetical protein
MGNSSFILSDLVGADQAKSKISIDGRARGQYLFKNDANFKAT